jgi:hypothetical protein
MSLTNFIALIAILVSASVVLIVSHLQRKQMRQIELFKLNQSVGLIPPQSWLTKFVKSKFDNFLGYGAPLISLTILFLGNDPVTKWTVLTISLNITLLIMNYIVNFFFKYAQQTTSLLANLINTQDSLRNNQEKQLEIVESSLKLITEVSSLKN